MATGDNLIIRKKIPIKLKEMPHLAESNVIIRKKIQLKLKDSYNKHINPQETIKSPVLEVKKPEAEIRKPQIMLKKKPVINQLNQYLDDNFKHHLMYIKESWSEVKYKIRLDNNNQECWWDLELLLIHFAEQLNSSAMSNPSPQWPSNPFNRVPFDKSQLSKLGKQIKELKLPVNYMIKELFNYLQTKFRYVNIEKFTGSFIAYVSSDYRFRIVNCKDSQGNYTGYWVKKTDPLSLFEERYIELKHITPGEYDDETDRIVERDEYIFYKDILNSMPQETIDLGSVAQESL